MSPQDEALLQKLMVLLGRLKTGDAEARQDVDKLKAAAKRGDKTAQRAFHSLSALYWKVNSPTWKKAEAFYDRLLKHDEAAWERFRRLQAASTTRVPAKQACAILKSIHNHRKESVWYPGAPRTGYYPMPTRHRPGIVIGANIGAPINIPGFGTVDSSQLGQLGQQFGLPSGQIPGAPGGGGVLPPQFTPQGFPGLGQVPGAPGGGGVLDPSQLAGLLGQLGQQVPGGFPSAQLPGGFQIPSGNALPGLGQLPGLLSQLPPGFNVPGLGNLDQLGQQAAQIATILRSPEAVGLGDILRKGQQRGFDWAEIVGSPEFNVLKAAANFLQPGLQIAGLDAPLPVTTEMASSVLSMLTQARNAPAKTGGPEDNLAKNDELARTGLSYSQAGLTWTDPRTHFLHPLGEVRKAGPNDDWRRGFDIGLAVGEGSTDYGPGQNAVRASLHNAAKEAGWDVGSAIAHDRTASRKALGGLERATDLPRNDALAAKGQAVVASGAVWTDPATGATRRLADIRSGQTLTYTRYDGQTFTDKITDEWRRGFDIGIAAADASTDPGPGQTAIQMSLRTIPKMSGFYAGQKIQHERNKQGARTSGMSERAFSYGGAMPPCPLTRSVVRPLGAAPSFVRTTTSAPFEVPRASSSRR